MLGAVIVDAGTLTGIGGSTISTPAPGIVRLNYGADQTDGQIHFVLDLGSAQNVDLFEFMNRSTATNLSLYRVNISIGDEGSGTFDPFNLNSYTSLVYPTSAINPSVNTGNAERTVDITNSFNRYFLFNVTANFNGAISQNPNATNLADFQNLSVTVVPEPSVLGLIVVASFGISLIRRIAFRYRRLAQI